MNVLPFGHGVLVTALGDTEEAKNALCIAACRDGVTVADGATPQQAWDAFAKKGGPHVILTFTNQESVDRLLRDLIEIRERLPE